MACYIKAFLKVFFKACQAFKLQGDLLKAFLASNSPMHFKLQKARFSVSYPCFKGTVKGVLSLLSYPCLKGLFKGFLLFLLKVV